MDQHKKKVLDVGVGDRILALAHVPQFEKYGDSILVFQFQFQNMSRVLRSLNAPPIKEDVDC